ncbi:AMP-binding protein [Streptomyces diastatochromogenes]|nr:AMP-binding protein [Streptomyces diastatochromogenes]
MAARLRAAGVTCGSLVGVCLDRTPDLAVALLGVWRAGAAYLPLDPPTRGPGASSPSPTPASTGSSRTRPPARRWRGCRYTSSSWAPRPGPTARTCSLPRATSPTSSTPPAPPAAPRASRSPTATSPGCSAPPTGTSTSGPTTCGR